LHAVHRNHRGKHGHRDPDPCPVVVGVVRRLRFSWKRQQLVDLWPESGLNGREQSFLGHDSLSCDVPPVESADDHAEIRQVDERTYPV
jgi:hypothetical protein